MLGRLLARWAGALANLIIVVGTLPWSFELVGDINGRYALLLIDFAALAGGIGFLTIGRLPWTWLSTRWQTDAVLAQSFTSRQDAALFAEMLSVSNDGRYPKREQSPQQRRQKTLEALIAQLEALSSTNPVLMIFEDAQWIDPTSLETLGRAVDRIRTLGVLLVVSYRPEFEAPWIGRPHVTALRPASFIPEIGGPRLFRARRSLLTFAMPQFAGRPQLRNLLKIRFERYQEASGFAARHNAMVEGERQRQHAPHRWLAQMRDHPLGNPAGAYDRHLRRHDDQVGKPASDHAEVRQRNGRAAQLARRY